MESYFLWASIGILTLFLFIGFICGLVRGLKRSSLHIIFFVLSIVVAFCITKTVTNAVLNVTATINGQTQTLNAFILEMLNQEFNLGAYDTATQFVGKLPLAIVAPILFILLSLGSYIVFDILYLIISRIAFGKKKVDFKEHKPHRWLGSFVGAVEGFLFLFILFAPLTALTKTYSEITQVQQQQQVLILSQQQISGIESPETEEENEEGGTQTDNHLKSIPQMLAENLPAEVNTSISAYNNSLLGKICGAGGLDKALFDGLSNFKLNGEKIKLRTELLNLADTYNNFVVVYNNYIDQNFEDIELTKLKSNIESFLNNGIFKTVVVDTFNDYVENFKFDSENPEDPSNPKKPTMIQEILLQLQAKQEEAEGKLITAQYLKDDITNLMDTAEQFLQSNLLKEINKLSDKTSVAMMEVIGQNTQEFEAILDKIFELNLLKDTFPAVANSLKEALKEVEQIDATAIENTTSAWKAEISLLCRAIEVLAKNTITVKELNDEGQQVDVTKSYLAYISKQGEKPEEYLQVLIRDMLQEKTVEGQTEKVIPFAQFLDPVFESNIFKPLVQSLFDEIDKTINELTGLTSKTDITNLKATKTETISAFVKFFNIMIIPDPGDVAFNRIAKILDVFNENAKSHSTDGKFDGVFNEQFINMIWYLSGNSIDGRTFDATVDEIYNEVFNSIYVVLPDEGSDPATYSGYYEVESFAEKYEEVQDVERDLFSKIENLKEGKVEEFVAGVVAVFEDKTVEQQNAFLDSIQKIYDSGNEDFLSEQYKNTYGQEILTKLNEYKDSQKLSEEVINKIEKLFGLEDFQPTNP